MANIHLDYLGAKHSVELINIEFRLNTRSSKERAIPLNYWRHNNNNNNKHNALDAKTRPFARCIWISNVLNKIRLTTERYVFCELCIKTWKVRVCSFYFVNSNKSFLFLNNPPPLAITNKRRIFTFRFYLALFHYSESNQMKPCTIMKWA